MDLVGAESRRGGTRGGRNNFSWDSVKKGDREFYLGNSVANVRHRWAVNDAPDGKEDDSLAAIRRREKAVLDAALGGSRSFAEAVRSALVDSGDNRVDDERGKVMQDCMDVVPKVHLRSEKSEKATRKAVRKQRREERRRRRVERQQRREERAAHRQGLAVQQDSSESERESIRSRCCDDSTRLRRRRKERETGTKRKRSDCISSSDMNDSDAVKSRRSRVR